MNGAPKPPDATPMFCARVRAEQPDDADGFMREDYRLTAELLRRYCNNDRASFDAVCSNNLSIILSALDKAGAV